MDRTLQISGIVIAMHVLGTAVMFGCISGFQAILATPLLSLFGWFFVLPELIGVGLQWFFYDYYPKPTKMKVFAFALLSALIGGGVVAIFTPKEQGNELEFWIAGFLAGAVAALFSFTCIHLIQSSEHEQNSESLR